MENENKNHTSIVGALGLIKKGTQKYVNEIPGNLSLAKVQIKKVLNREVLKQKFIIK